MNAEFLEDFKKIYKPKRIYKYKAKVQLYE